MKGLFKRRSSFIFLTILFLTVLIRFYNLSGGIVLGEPDEVTHEEILEGFRTGLWPRYSGGPWYYELPLYPLVSYFLSFILPERFMALRVVSVLAIGFLVFGIYYYLKEKIGKRTAFLSALLFSLSPFALFYSRVGMLDASVVSFSLLSLIFFDLSFRRNPVLFSLLSGFFLGLGVLVKYSALIFFAVPMISFLIYSFWGSIRYFKELKTIVIDSRSFLTLLTAAILILPPAAVLFQHDRYLFKLHLKTNLGLLRDGWWLQSRGFGISDFIAFIPWWLGWIVILLALVGVVFLAKKFREWSLFFSYFAVVIFAVFTRTPFYPRYFLLLIPFVSVLAGAGLGYIWDFLERQGRWRLGMLFAFIAFLLVLPSSVEGFRSSRHLLLEEASKAVSESQVVESAWLFSTYWPNFFSFLTGNRQVGWLADSSWEAGAFYDTKNLSSLQVLKDKGGVALIEDLYSSRRAFKNPSSRLVAREEVEKNFSPSKIVYDREPNFPHYREETNKISIYFFDGGAKRD